MHGAPPVVLHPAGWGAVPGPPGSAAGLVELWLRDLRLPAPSSGPIRASRKYAARSHLDSPQWAWTATGIQPSRVMTNAAECALAHRRMGSRLGLPPWDAPYLGVQLSWKPGRSSLLAPYGRLRPAVRTVGPIVTPRAHRPCLPSDLVPRCPVSGASVRTPSTCAGLETSGRVVRAPDFPTKEVARPIHLNVNPIVRSRLFVPPHRV